MRWCRLLLLMVCVLTTETAVAQTGRDVQPGRDVTCDLGGDLLNDAMPLPRTAAALGKHRLEILALGSGSTVGDSGGAGGPALVFHAPGSAYPYRLAEALRTLRPEVTIDVTVRGGRSLTASDMLTILRNELARTRFDLVLWQTGTVEAVQGVAPDELRDNLLDGAAAVNSATADLVLIDPQFSRFLRANADVGPYETVLRQVAGNDGVALFPRFDLTQSWVNDGKLDVERVSRDARDKTIALLHTCLGGALARFILAGAAAAH
jgi:acyl-CoA thioesterase I